MQMKGKKVSDLLCNLYPFFETDPYMQREERT